MNRILKLFLLVALPTVVILTSAKDVNASRNIQVLLEGQEILFDVAPQIVEGRTLVPMRAIFEAIGLTVNWDDSTKVATGSNPNNTIVFSIGSSKAIVNNQEKILDVPASIINGRTMVPLRFLSENMDYNVIWVGESSQILLSKDDIVEWKYEGFESVEPFKEYEVKYVNGQRTSETRYNGKNHDVKVEWRFEGHEGAAPYKEYEVKYIDGKRTSETRYTGTNWVPITIIDEGFYNEGTDTLYYVEFSDGFIIMVSIPKIQLGYTYESVVIRVDGSNSNTIINPSTISIVGFSNAFDEIYYPLSFTNYSTILSNSEKTQVKGIDFFLSLNKYNTDKNITGMVVYDSFVMLEGVNYSDGIHSCYLYLE